ncbi:seminal metalloprotease 1-like [Belonocnema kinseyi]|uniref:seminal metalloprotease 1-like n=1 Tax=Belonocnema kinseyi TaxID=2817044 RepID=UPI00143D8066|nr:seminal metalloprotease 1-like [Belonocnema kinseyi]
MRSTLVKIFSRISRVSGLLFFIFGFQNFVSIYAAPIDSSISFSKENRDSSVSPELSEKNTGIIDGISYRLDAWSQYDNPEEGNEREGDIHDFPESRKTTTRDRKLLWPKGVVKYWIHSSIRNEPKKLEILKEAMDTIMEKTCVKFKEIFPDEKGSFPSSSWLNVTGNKRGCFSDLGRSRFGASNLNLDLTRCFRNKGHAMHEMLHTLGVYHEQMRPDRDDHIKIVWDNIKEHDVFNFRRLSNEIVTTYGLPYDYDSIMHYSMTAFAKNKSKPSIIPLKQTTPIGQRDHLSLSDIKKLLITYKCKNIESVYENEMKNYDSDELIEEYEPEEAENSPTEAFDKENYEFDVWSLLDKFNFSKYYFSPFYGDYMYYL